MQKTPCGDEEVKNMLAPALFRFLRFQVIVNKSLRWIDANHELVSKLGTR
jgi:hypothetical protein